MKNFLSSDGFRQKNRKISSFADFTVFLIGTVPDTSKQFPDSYE